jgi:membrane protease YdiL (CAAX protease family)
MNKSIRDMIIFCVVALGGGFLGIALDRLSPPQNPMQGLGALVWLVSPLAANLLLRAFGGDGWKDFGILPKFKSSWPWYLVALVIAPLVTLAALIWGTATGAVSLSGFSEQGFGAFLPLAGGVFVAVMVKNFFEEFAWRGYLTPRFEALKLHPFANSLLTGFVWAGWHVPYYLYFLNRSELQAHTSLSVPAFILMSFLVLPFQALAYGELRLISKTVWTTWLLHNVANAISLPLLSSAFVTLEGGAAGVILSPGTEGIIYALLMGLVGLGLYFYRQQKAQANLAIKQGQLIINE